jgi:hypothetical protein
VATVAYAARRGIVIVAHAAGHPMLQCGAAMQHGSMACTAMCNMAHAAACGMVHAAMHVIACVAQRGVTV